MRKGKAKIMDEFNHELPSLKLENAEFKQFSKLRKKISGIDKVVSKLKQPKSDLGDIKSISSGGELCRIALAIKVTAEKILRQL